MAGIKIVDLPALGRDLISTDLLELSLAGGTGSRKITGQEIMNASKLSVGNTPIINGAVGQVLFQGTGNVLQQSSSLFWDAPNDRLIVGSTGSSGTIAFPTTTSGFSPIIQSQFGGNNIIFSIGGRNFTLNGGGGITTTFNTTITGSTGSAALVVAQGNSGWTPIADFNGSSGTALRVNTNGNVLIGTTTDAGYKLDVNGAARVVTSIDVNGKKIHGGASALLSNTAYGFNTLTATSANGDNTAIGYIALQNNTGTINTAVGSYSLNQNSSGSQNVGIGGYAGSSVTSGSNNVLIGYNSQLGSGGQSNQIVIGHGATGAGSNTATLGNDSITTTVLKGNVGIGTSSPQEKLDINGSLRIRLNSSNLTAVQDTSVIDYVNTSIFTTTPALRISAVGTTSIAAQIRFLAGTATEMNAGTAERMRIFGGGNIGINTTTDAGFRLDVNGTAIVRGILNVNSALTGLSFSNADCNIFNNGGGAGNISFSMSGSKFLNIWQITGSSSGYTSGTHNTIQTSLTYAWSSGTAISNAMVVSPTINNTGTYSGTFRGFYYNPTITSLTGTSHFAFHSTSGRVRFEGLPTSPTGLNAGDIYNDGGTLKIV